MPRCPRDGSGEKRSLKTHLMFIGQLKRVRLFTIINLVFCLRIGYFYQELYGDRIAAACLLILSGMCNRDFRFMETQKLSKDFSQR